MRSGKTTFLNNILEGTHGKRIAVIENEFGEVLVYVMQKFSQNAFDVDCNQQEECGSTLTIDYNQHRMHNQQMNIPDYSFDVHWNQQEECCRTLPVDSNEHRMNFKKKLSSLQKLYHRID